jgi:protein-S-isoprenylcysteine O-methyltransferase Ste14
LADNPGVVAKPPTLLLIAIALGFALELAWPTELRVSGWARSAACVPLIGLGIVGVQVAMRQFRDAGTNIETDRPSETVVTTGLYAHSRNPIYVCLTMLLAGVGIAANSLWLLGMAIPFLLVVRYGVIAREERYLLGKFGEPYRAYTAAVRRWL